MKYQYQAVDSWPFRQAVDLHLDQDHQPAAMGLGVARPLGKALVGKCTIYLYLYVYIYIDVYVYIYISIDVYVYIYRCICI